MPRGPQRIPSCLQIRRALNHINRLIQCVEIKNQNVKLKILNSSVNVRLQAKNYVCVLGLIRRTGASASRRIQYVRLVVSTEFRKPPTLSVKLKFLNFYIC